MKSGTPARAAQLCAAALVLAVLTASPAGTGGGAANDTLSQYRNIPLWDDGQVPLAAGDGPLDKPFLTAFLPPPARRNGGAVVIAPGGANIMLMYGAEGLEIAERYNDWGVTAFVLTYRLSPRYRDDARVADGTRAIRLVRARAAEWRLDPARIGYIGFSAGSNMGRAVVAASSPGLADAADPVDRVSSRPDYLALVYGAGRAATGEALETFPPTFLVSAAGDRGPSLGNAQLFMDLTRAGAVAELHIYQKGRHGFGSGFGSPEFGDWMGALEHFLRVGRFLPAAK